MNLGNIIKSYREDNKISQDEFAKMTGLSKAYISILERNRKPVNNKPAVPSLETIKAVAHAIGMDFNELIAILDGEQPILLSPTTTGIKIPVLGRVAAGIPIDAIEDVLDWEEIPQSMAATGEYFGLKIKGDSMLPDIKNGDVVIVRRQEQVENGEIAIVLINGDEATAKKVKHTESGIMLIPNNPSFEPMFFSKEEIATKPVQIIGRVVELRRTI